MHLINSSVHHIHCRDGIFDMFLILSTLYVVSLLNKAENAL